MTNRLCLHVDSHPISKDALSSIECPDPTSTWEPVSHFEFVEMIEDAAVKCGIGINEMKIGLSAVEKPNTLSGQKFGLTRHRLFGVMETNTPVAQGDACMSIGFRNSTDQSFAASIVAGARVFVCDNRMFIGEHVVNRKHTSNIYRDLPPLLEDGIVKAVDEVSSQENMWDVFKSLELDDTYADHVMVMAANNGVIPWAKIPRVREQWLLPEHDDFAERNAWSLYNGFTNVLRDYPTDAMASRTMRLTTLFREHMCA